MATKFFLGREAYTADNPGTLGTWGGSYKSLYKLATTTFNTSFVVYTINGHTAGTTIMRQYVTEPMSSGITFGAASTYNVVIRYKESTTAANAFACFYLAIVSEDGTTVRSQAASLEKDGTEFGTSLAARSNSNTGILPNYTTVAGDRLVLEIGWDMDGGGTASLSISLGDDDATFLSGEGDTDIDSPWFETSVDITFGGEGGGGVSNEDYTSTSYISGVLDEEA